MICFNASFRHMVFLLICGVYTQTGEAQGPVKVTLQRSAQQNWELQRNGQPYKIHGAGGMGSLKLLAQYGGNSNRTWGVDDVVETKMRLDEAHQHGISVAFGLWLEHERHGFDYRDQNALKKQFEVTLAHVERFKDHPAILVWGVGNEMEGATGDNPLIWDHVEQIAARIKAIDPNHPVMTVVAEIGGEKVQAIHRYCPSVDIIGINSYGGTDSLPQRYRDAKGTKPYIVTEFGPNGPWEIGVDSIGAVVEPTSTEKAAKYRRSFLTLKADSQLCLGSYAFLWGHKQEATTTWFGMFTKDGRRTNSVDTMAELWSGKPLTNLTPDIKSISINGQSEVGPGELLKISVDVKDPESDPLKMTWAVMSEADKLVTGGDLQSEPSTIQQAIIESTNSMATVKAPSEPGLYRVFVYVADSATSNATANVAFRVRATNSHAAGNPVVLPYVVYDEPGEPSGYTPSGWMGSTEFISMDERCTDDPKSGKYCVRFGYSSPNQWGGVVWQNPPEDWGDKPGGFDLSNATHLSFWARGEVGGEKLKAGFGLLGRDKSYWDTAKRETEELTLEKTWKQYRLEIPSVDLSRIKTGFYWTLAGQGKPVTFYFDRIVFENARKSGGELP